MPINYCTAAGGSGYGVYREFPEKAKLRVEAIFRNLDLMMPGFYHVLNSVDASIVYDARNRHGFLSDTLESKGRCYWPLIRIYLGNSGISRGTVHETWHLIDMLAGPLKQDLQKSWKHRDGNISFLTYCLYPTSSEKPDTTGIGGKILEVVVQPPYTSDETRKKLLLDKMCNGIDHAYDVKVNWGLGDFLSERFANLLEEWFFYRQLSLGTKKPDGVGGKEYFTGGLWWGEEWLRQHDQELRSLFSIPIRTIKQYEADGLLSIRVNELKAAHWA
jgi:hypothetical protein